MWLWPINPIYEKSVMRQPARLARQKLEVANFEFWEVGGSAACVLVSGLHVETNGVRRQGVVALKFRRRINPPPP